MVNYEAVAYDDSYMLSQDIARRIQDEKLVQINTAPAHNIPSGDSIL